MPCPEKTESPTEVLFEHAIKGCVHWFDVTNDSNPKISSQKARPYIIISQSNKNSSRVTISPITDRKHRVENGTDILKYPDNAPLYKKDNPFLDKDSVALLDQVYTIDKDELCEEWYMGKIDDCAEIDKAIMYNYDLFASVYNIYEELFRELNGMVKKNYLNNYSRK